MKKLFPIRHTVKVMFGDNIISKNDFIRKPEARKINEIVL